jgi:hypothetical protein
MLKIDRIEITNSPPFAPLLIDTNSPPLSPSLRSREGEFSIIQCITSPPYGVKSGPDNYPEEVVHGELKGR